MKGSILSARLPRFILRLERCDKIQNPVNGEDLDVKEIDWKCNRSNEVYPKRAARQDVVNVGELEG